MPDLIGGNPLSAPVAAASSFLKRKDFIKEETIALEELPNKNKSKDNADKIPEYHLSPGSDLTVDVHGTRDPPLYGVDSKDGILNPDEGVEFPEGGIKAYTVVFGAFMGLIPSFGLINSVGAIESYISAHQLADVSTSTISWIFTINTFVTFFSMIFSGALFDRHGSFGPLLVGTILFCSGLMATANAKNTWQFIVTLCVVGVGNGILISPLCGVVSHYFNKKRATALSIATTGGSVGGIVVPLLLRGLYTSVGFEWAIRILSFFSLFCLGWALFIAKERFKDDSRKIHSRRDFLDVYILGLFDYKAMRETRFFYCSIAVALTESGLIVASLYYPSYVIKRGYPETTAYLLITVVNTTGILGRYIPAYIADKYLGRFNVAILTVIFCSLFILILWLPFGYNLKILYAYSAIYGFFSGTILSLPPACVGQISRTEEFGRRYSTMYLIVSFSTIISIPVAGVIIGNGSVREYNHFIVYVACLLGGGAVFYGASRYCCVGLKLCKF